MTKKYRDVHEYEALDPEDLSGTLDQVITTLQNLAEEHGAQARLEITGSDDGYDSNFIYVELRWVRPETDAERNARLKKAYEALDPKAVREKAAKNKILAEEKEKLQYEKLKQKYGNSCSACGGDCADANYCDEN